MMSIDRDQENRSFATLLAVGWCCVCVWLLPGTARRAGCTCRPPHGSCPACCTRRTPSSTRSAGPLCPARAQHAAAGAHARDTVMRKVLALGRSWCVACMRNASWCCVHALGGDRMCMHTQVLIDKLGLVAEEECFRAGESLSTRVHKPPCRPTGVHACRGVRELASR